jgi:hypothetical protein
VDVAEGKLDGRGGENFIPVSPDSSCLLWSNPLWRIGVDCCVAVRGGKLDSMCNLHFQAEDHTILMTIGATGASEVVQTTMATGSTGGVD